MTAGDFRGESALESYSPYSPERPHPSSHRNAHCEGGDESSLLREARHGTAADLCRCGARSDHLLGGGVCGGSVWSKL